LDKVPAGLHPAPGRVKEGKGLESAGRDGELEPAPEVLVEALIDLSIEAMGGAHGTNDVACVEAELE
jgi:hypothetical protein